MAGSGSPLTRSHDRDPSDHRRRPNRAQTQPRVLIVRPSALGDVSRTVPALVTLRRALPHAQIDWLVNDSYAPAIAHHPDLDDVVLFPRRRFSRFLRNRQVTAEAMSWARSLRARRYDLVLDLQGLFRSGLLTWLTAAHDRVGYANARELAWLAYNHRHRVETRLHTVDRMLALLQAHGYTPCHDMRLYISREDQDWFDDWRRQHAPRDRGYFCIAPTAKWLSKCWPIEKFAAVARRLLDRGIAGNRLVVLTAPGERHRVERHLQSFRDLRDVALFPETTVGQLMALIHGARLVVCNDSAPLHIAVGFNRPVVAVFGPTDPALVGPYRRPEAVVRPLDWSGAAKHHYRQLRHDQTLIARVTVDQVWEAIARQLRPPAARHEPTIAPSNSG